MHSWNFTGRTSFTATTSFPSCNLFIMGLSLAVSTGLQVLNPSQRLKVRVDWKSCDDSNSTVPRTVNPSDFTTRWTLPWNWTRWDRSRNCCSPDRIRVASSAPKVMTWADPSEAEGISPSSEAEGIVGSSTMFQKFWSTVMNFWQPFFGWNCIGESKSTASLITHE